MLPSKLSKEETNQLFTKLLGFKKGDRVKRKVRRKWEEESHYWQYGTITRENPEGWDYPYSVLWDGNSYAVSYKAEHLTRVRSYEKSW